MKKLALVLIVASAASANVFAGDVIPTGTVGNVAVATGVTVLAVGGAVAAANSGGSDNTRTGAASGTSGTTGTH